MTVATVGNPKAKRGIRTKPLGKGAQLAVDYALFYAKQMFCKVAALQNKQRGDIKKSKNYWRLYYDRKEQTEAVFMQLRQHLEMLGDK